jgi:hypothetical protein
LESKHFDCFRIHEGVIIRKDHHDYLLGILEMIGRCYLPKKSKKDVPKLVKFFTEALLLFIFPGASSDPEIFSAPDSNNAMAPPFFSMR